MTLAAKSRATMVQGKQPSTKNGISNVYLLVVILIQWLLMSYLLVTHHDTHHKVDEATTLAAGASSSTTITPLASLQKTTATKPRKLVDGLETNTTLTNPQGVLATVIFRAPKWFHLRYTTMLHNALVNSPPDWALQIYLNGDWVKESMIQHHPGLLRLLQHDRVQTTLLPSHLTAPGKKQQGVLLDKWFWTSLVSDHVLLFSGNGAFCGQHIDYRIYDMLVEQLDFCGTPTTQYWGQGGSGATHSYRNRQGMLQVLDYLTESSKDGGDKQKGRPEHGVFVETMMEMNKKGLHNFRIASNEQTHMFGGVDNVTSEESPLPLVVSGTQGRLSWDEREALLKRCPELKMIFPSMHEPACFGAHPNPDQCRASICALQETIPSSGC